MRHLTVTIPDNFYDSFVNFFQHMPEVAIQENKATEIPQWQQDIVLERIKNAKPEDFLKWEDVEKELDAKWL